MVNLKMMVMVVCMHAHMLGRGRQDRGCGRGARRGRRSRRRRSILIINIMYTCARALSCARKKGSQLSCFLARNRGRRTLPPAGCTSNDRSPPEPIRAPFWRRRAPRQSTPVAATARRPRPAGRQRARFRRFFSLEVLSKINGSAECWPGAPSDRECRINIA